eukprot:TRINITY_DN11711_c0_g1_i1.p1 TRINITY_DN11711_c0_g1~~TRINITY_DN11711_c0_g1_i1.p1  ORF type:complete len:376 (+),score=45.90 TRINITY_DN11711_c0_g1_i1:84-1211(+)
MQSLRNVTAGNLVADQPALVTATLTDSVEVVLQLMARHHIVSLPLMNEAHQFVGIISLQDLVLDLVWRPEERSRLPSTLTRQVRDVYALREEAKQLWVLQETDSILSCLGPMSSGVHRALVPKQAAEGRGLTYSVLSQFDIVRFLHAHKREFAALLEKSIGDMHLGVKYTLETVTADQKTFDCFKKLGDEYVSAVAIIDNMDGSLVGTLSATDLRGFTVAQLPYLGKSLQDFLFSQHGAIKPPIFTTNSSSLETVIDLLLDNRVHRVWIVKDRMPTGVVTLTDLLDCVYKFYGGEEESATRQKAAFEASRLGSSGGSGSGSGSDSGSGSGAQVTGIVAGGATGVGAAEELGGVGEEGSSLRTVGDTEGRGELSKE